MPPLYHNDLWGKDAAHSLKRELADHLNKLNSAARGTDLSVSKLNELFDNAELWKNYQGHEAEAKAKDLARQGQRQGEESLVWYHRNNQAGEYEDIAENTAFSSIYRYFNIQDLLAQFFLGAHFDHGRVANWRNFCVGINSFCYGLGALNVHMPLLDYDGKNVRKQIRNDVQKLQEDYRLSDAWVYETRRGFHVYFFCDYLPLEEYLEALGTTQACEGFRNATERMSASVLRVSAKYTKFDIKPLYVLKAAKPTGKRMLRKAHVVQALLSLGEDCGTHFASLFPQWARFQEDPKEWRLASKGKGKRIRKKRNLETFEAQPIFEPIKLVDEPGAQPLYYNTTASTTTSSTIDVGSGDSNSWFTFGGDNGTGSL